MKGNRLRTLAFALVGGLALLFAGCGQQAQLAPTKGNLAVNVTPADAQVTVTGPNNYNQTFTGGKLLTDLEPGAYTVTASKQGYVTASKSAVVEAGKTTTVDLVLQPVQTGQPTTIAVEGLYETMTNQPVDLNNVQGQVIVRAKVALGSVVPDKVQFLLDGNVEYEVSFGAATQGVRPQQATYTFEWKLNTAALNGTQPKYLNGPHTVSARLVKGGNPIATSSATSVRFNNQDRVLLSIQGNSAPDPNNYTWYGGQDLALKAVPVLYSGRPASKVKFSGMADDIPNTTVLASSAQLDLGAGTTATNSSPIEVPVTSGQAQLTIQKSLNGGVEGGIYIFAQIRYADDGTLGGSGDAYFALDFVGPNFNDYYVNLNGVYPGTFSNITTQTSSWLNGQSPITVKATDNGVGGVTYQVQVLQGSTVVATLNPGDTLASVPEGNNYKLQVVNLKDALGNAPATNPSPTSTFNLDKTKPALTTTFGANGKVLNGMLTTGYEILGKLTETGSGLGTTLQVGAAPTASSPGQSGWLIQVTRGSCTYTIDSGTGFSSANLPLIGSNASYTVNQKNLLAGSAPSGCSPYALTDGNYTFTIRAIDQARNVSDPITVSFYWLTQKPVVQFLQSPSGTYSLGGSSYVQVNGALKVSHPAGIPIYKAILYSTGGSTSSDVQLVASPNVNLNNSTAPTFNSDASINPATASFYNFTASAGNFPFTLQFNATGSFQVAAAAVPEAYDNTGALNVTGLSNSTSASVTVNL
ncbi:PEGA domain-containing protein [Thermus scotoductus]|uniref:PEGA domain-containing protein n=1 Tax=Thermus scotoductus TaxID=37636 RepID=UPI001561EC5F|nr:PEGA domain-containing protein [Thermus scotoductus]